MRLIAVLILLALTGCYRGDSSWNEPTTEVVLARKGCRVGGRAPQDLLVNIESKKLDDGRTQCVITTVTNGKEDK